MEGWKPNSQRIRLAVTHTVVIKNDATFLPHTTFQHRPCEKFYADGKELKTLNGRLLALLP